MSLALVVIVIGEILLCSIIIMKISYTEIDWIAYMQEVEGFLDGELNYFNLHGDTGPLVYPAAFVYIYVGLYWLTDSGADIFTAQYIFMGLYVSLIVLVLSIYRRAGGKSMPFWSILLVCTSRRVHSIFVLRLFNDGVAMWLLYAAVFLFLLNRWRFGCAVYSLAVGVKMNILLSAPGLLLVLLQANGMIGTIVCLSICAGIQLLLGSPFLLHHPVAYLARSFELGRVFKYEWTVNFKFLSEEAFVSQMLSVALLALTVIVLVLFAVKWLRSTGPIYVRDVSTREGERKQLLPEYVVKTLFVSNFIGIVFCRSLHYQFYSWYYHTLPFLLWQTDLPVMGRLAVLAGIEISFNIFPATSTSSAVLQVCHAVLLAALWIAPVMKERKPDVVDKRKNE